MSKNDGTILDDHNEADDWIELYNSSAKDISLKGYTIRDSTSDTISLKQLVVPAGGYLILWADDTPDQGTRHLPLKLSATGDKLTLSDSQGISTDTIDIPALDADQSFSRFPDGSREFKPCIAPTPGKENGPSCTPTSSILLEESLTFRSYIPPSNKKSFFLSQIDLRPEYDRRPTITVTRPANSTMAAQASASPALCLKIFRDYPADSNQSLSIDVPLPLNLTTLPVGDSRVIDIAIGALSPLIDSDAIDGHITLSACDSKDAIDSVSFAFLRSNDVLQKSDATAVSARCIGISLPCNQTALTSDVRYLHTIRNSADFTHVAQGGIEIGSTAVKFIIDLERANRIYFTRTADWDLHYTFVREAIEGLDRLDRCDTNQFTEFARGWSEFSVREYDEPINRRFLMGTLVHYVGSNFSAIEFPTGDTLQPAYMKHVYEIVRDHVYNGDQYVIVPRGDDQIAKIRSIEGTIPARGPNAPFVDLNYQILNPGIAYGYLRNVPSDQLNNRSLGQNDILYTDFAPANLPAVRGLITAAFQTPLSHANVLSRNRQTPNIVLRDSKSPIDLIPLIGKLVRLEVDSDGVTLSAANLANAQAFWGEQPVTRSPRLSKKVQSISNAVTDINQISYNDLPTFGGKTVQFAELTRIDKPDPLCSGTFPAPMRAMAMPIYFYLNHIEAAGADELIAKLNTEQDETKRLLLLDDIRKAITNLPLRSEIIDRVYAEVQSNFGDKRIRFRSSSNTEDLPGFNGAGLYESVGINARQQGKAGIAEAITTIWSSLWSERAHRERRYFGVDESNVGMGILIHEAIQSEVSNGVAISRSVLNPLRGDIYYVNVQRGNASVVKPANQITAEQYSYHWGRNPRQTFHARSSFLDENEVVLNLGQASALACHLRQVHDHFRPIIDPTGSDDYFAMDIEFKFLGPSAKDLIIKQARPYTFAQVEQFSDCRTRE